MVVVEFSGKKPTPLNRVWNYHVFKSKQKVYNNSGSYRHSSLALIFMYEYGPRHK